MTKPPGHLLVTGFEPFHGVPSNPTERILSSLPCTIGHWAVETEVLPVDTWAVGPRIEARWARRPAAVLHLGVATQDSRLRLERRAENARSFRVPDNGGRTLQGEPIEPEGPRYIASRLPLADIAQQWTHAGLDFMESDSAGTFLCNQVMYMSLYHLPTEVPVGFIHVPPDEELAALTSTRIGGWVPLRAQVEGIRLALSAIASPLRHVG